MLFEKSFIFFTILCITFGIVSAATNKVVCYHGTWSTYRNGNGKFSVENIDTNLCTHVIYAFVGINSNGEIKLLDEYLDITTGNFQRFNSLKQKNSKLKTLVAIGGWNEGSVTFSTVAASAQKRSNLLRSTLNLLQTYGFDGFDFDWEYPGQRGGAAADKANFAQLLQEFRTAFDEHGYILTAAVAAASGSVDLSYDVPALSKYLDFINVMAYDFHASWDGVTGQNAPLYASSVDQSANQKLLNVDAAIRGWISRGADPQKLILGIGTYGRSFTLSSSSNHGVGAPTIGAGQSGPYTLESGMLGYNEICEAQLGGGWTTVWDDEQKTPYMYKDNQWVGYDNARSVAVKTEYAKQLNLGGVMIWSIETEDFLGKCGSKYPLLNAIRTALGGTSDESQTADNDNNRDQNSDNNNNSKRTRTTTTTTTTEKSNGLEESIELCVKAGYVRDPDNCSFFYYCLPNAGGFVPLQQQCNFGLVFDTNANVCNYPSLVQC